MVPPTTALDRLFTARFGAAPVDRTPLAAQGSRRRMFRLIGVDGESAVGVHGPDAKENRAFVGYARAFRDAGLPVPEVLGEDPASQVYLVEDLGDQTLFEALAAARQEHGGAFPDAVRPLFERSLQALAQVQVEGGRVADYDLAHPRAVFDAQSMRWDLNLFKYLFLRLAEIPFDEAGLEADMQRLASFLEAAPAEHFLYRDFQSRNVMVRDGTPWLIDFQGGRRGALQYDVASLLFEGGTALPESVRASLLESYLGFAETLVPLDREVFLRHYRGFVLIRILQALGAYGLLGLHRRQVHFLRSIPNRQADLRHLMETGFVALDLPELGRVLQRVVDAEIPGVPATPAQDGRLHVRLVSFSYKRGLPVDPGGHGGGHVFDCRAVPNPGREEAFRRRTGLDKSVQDWLGERGVAHRFFEGARRLVEQHIRTFRQRGFDSLHVAFGCTGGQHRSVYFAERMATHLRTLFQGVAVEVTHRERSHWPR